MSHCLPLVALAVAAGCSACVHLPENFVPTERASATSPEGHRSAIYDVVIDGEVVGEMRVWSDGAEMEELPGEERALLHVGFRLESNGPDLLIEESEVRVGRLVADGEILEDLEPTYLDGVTTASLGADAEAHFYFAVPGPYDPQDLDAFRVRWRVAGNDARRYTQTTPFLEYEPARYYYAWSYAESPYYDPFLSPWYYSPGRVIVHPIP